MAVMYTEQDIEGFKGVMARCAAKNNRLIEKWTKFRNQQIADLSKLSEEKPSAARDAYQLVLERARDVAELILKDLVSPADFFSHYEWSNVSTPDAMRRIASTEQISLELKNEGVI